MHSKREEEDALSEVSNNFQNVQMEGGGEGVGGGGVVWKEDPWSEQDSYCHL